MRGITLCGRDALDLIFETHIASRNLRMDLARNDATAGPGAAEKNRKYNAHVERFVARSMVCLAVDTYHLYLQQLLALIWVHHPEAKAKVLQEYARTRKATTPEELLSLNLQATDLRDAIHGTLNIHLDPEIPVLCEVRNVLAHSDGSDRRGKLREALNNLTELGSIIWPMGTPKESFPVFLNEKNELRIDFPLGDIACELMQNQIHLMDQNASFLYKLPTERERPRTIRRAMGHFGVPFRTAETDHKPAATTPPPYSKPMPPLPAIDRNKMPPGGEAEVTFARIRRRLWTDIDEFVAAYAQEAKLQLKLSAPRMSGSVHGHTIAGHDLALDYHFLPPSAHYDATPEHLGIRIRHDNWQPKVTVWCTNGMMQDFPPPELHEPLKEKIRTCMDQAFRQQ